MIEIVSALQTWFTNACDGTWEHGQGICIETIDNPGWSVKIDLSGTKLSKKPFEEIQVNRSETNWFTCRVQQNVFEGFGGASNLSDIIETFLSWDKMSTS